MRILLYIVILALLFLAPVQRLDVAELEPVQTVAVSAQEEQVTIQTDTGQQGSGSSIAAAVEKLEDNTPGVIYLDTAQYLLITPEAESFAEQLRPYLHGSTKVCVWDGKSSVKEAAQYLRVRTNLPTFRTWKTVAKKLEN